jgi:hypothetical protein
MMTETSRDETIATLKAELKARTGKAWSVKGGRGTAWGWITVSAPPKRCNDNGHMTADDCAELALLFRLGTRVSSQGISIPASSAYYREYVARIKGETFEAAQPYWD